MNYYMDDQALVADQTLIRMTCAGRKTKVPASFGGHPVRAVGGGALILADVEDLIFAPGIVELKDHCVGGAASLRRIWIPETVRSVSDRLFVLSHNPADLDLYIDRAISPELYRDLCRNMQPVYGKSGLVPMELLALEEMKPVRNLAQSDAPCLETVCGEMGILFHAVLSESDRRERYSGTIFEPRPCYDLLHGRKEVEEYTAVMEMIRAGKEGWRDSKTEEMSDAELRTGTAQSRMFHQNVSVVLCENPPHKPGPDEQYHLRFHVRGARLFFPSLRRIRHQRSDWWIYCRNYLTFDAQRPYMREEVGIFDRNGLVTDPKASEDVYAKYRFLSLL